MRVFVTGASGFIGSAVVRELIGAGHQVLGLARSDASEAAIKAAGAEVHRGDLADLDGLSRLAESAEGVVHAGYNHDFFHDPSVQDFMAAFVAAAEADRRAIGAFGRVLAGSDRPLVFASGAAGLVSDRIATEEDGGDVEAGPLGVRRLTEQIALAMASEGVRVSSMRLPPTVHGDGDRGFVPGLIQIARARGVSAYVGEGLNRWPAVHKLDAASLFRLALEKAPAGTRLHPIAEEGVTIREVADVIGRKLNLPVASIPAEAAGEHFGRLAFVIGMDCPTSSRLTRERLGWNPTRRTLIEDLEQGTYFDNQ